METCNILGVNIAVTNMKETVEFLQDNLESIKGNYICVSNVHTTVMSYEDEGYRKIQNGGVLALPDGKPLSSYSRKKGFTNAERVTGPDLMYEIFKISEEKGYRHYFYGSTDDTLDLMKEKLLKRFPKLQIAGIYSPPFRKEAVKEDQEVIDMINETRPDFLWVGLGAPKQERWMYLNRNRINAIMLGVGAGFDYCADKIQRAPKWMQKASLEWLYRLMQDPKRLFKRYYETNKKFIYLTKFKAKNKMKKVCDEMEKKKCSDNITTGAHKANV